MNDRLRAHYYTSGWMTKEQEIAYCREIWAKVTMEHFRLVELLEEMDPNDPRFKSFTAAMIRAEGLLLSTPACFVVPS